MLNQTIMGEIKIGLVEYPGAMTSAVLGLLDMFQLANNICDLYSEAKMPNFSVSRWQVDDSGIRAGSSNEPAVGKGDFLDVVIIPPSISGTYYEAPNPRLIEWIRKQHNRGTVTCSACAGCFILAATGLLDERRATTHWDLSSRFTSHFPRVRLDSDEVLINDGDLVTAGGLMSWMDLGLELVAQFTRPTVMIELGKYLIIDTGRREQRYYKKFVPRLGHGNAAVVKAQHYIQRHFHAELSVKALARHCHLGERTLLRQFLSATGFTPTEYIQNVRIQKARELIETSSLPVETIASRVGYEDSGAFRKVFRRLTGLSPKEFRQRFGRDQTITAGT